MNKKLVIGLFLSLALLFNAKAVRAEEETCIETQVYGGGVATVCGAKTHEPVDTGIEDTIGFFAGGLLIASYVFSRIPKKAQSTS